MKRLTPLASLLAGTGMMLMISASQAGTASEAIAQAEADLAAAQSEAQKLPVPAISELLFFQRRVGTCLTFCA